MEAPEKLYVDTEDRLSGSILYGFTEKRKDNDIEYIRTDAFIEKAEKFIYSALNDGIMGTANIEDFMKLFKKYMKGE
jgi:hypothetical protein